MKRRASHQRGTPVRAGLTWMLLEEVRTTTENYFNFPQRLPERPFQQTVQKLFGEFV